jgi:hypothetical protein
MGGGRLKLLVAAENSTPAPEGCGGMIDVRR